MLRDLLAKLYDRDAEMTVMVRTQAPQLKTVRPIA